MKEIFLSVKGGKERALNRTVKDYLWHILTFVFVFLMFSEPWFWGFVQNWIVVSNGVLLGSPIGLILGIVSVKFLIVPRIKGGTIRGINKGGFLIGLIGFCIVGVLLFFDVMDSTNTPFCQVFDIQGGSLCMNFLQGILIGYFLGILILECVWVRYWEIQNKRILYIESKEDSTGRGDD